MITEALYLGAAVTVEISIKMRRRRRCWEPQFVSIQCAERGSFGSCSESQFYCGKFEYMSKPHVTFQVHTGCFSDLAVLEKKS